MTTEATDTSTYAEDRTRNWERFSNSAEPLPSYWDWWERESHGWKIPIEFLQPLGLDAPEFIEPLRPLLDTLAGLEEVELFPTPYLHMKTVHVGFLMATDIMWSQVESIYVNAAPRLHRLDPFPLKFGGVSATDHTLYLGVDDGNIVKEIRRMVRLAVPTVYQKAREDPNYEHFVPRVDFAYFTGKGDRRRVVEAVAPHLEAQAGEATVEQVKMSRVPLDPQTYIGDLDVIAEIRLYGKNARQGYHT